MDKANFEKTVETCDETQLYLIINQLGGSIFYVRHDLADGRCDSTPEIEQWLVDAQEMIGLAVDQTARFGVAQPRDVDSVASPEYWTWYRKRDAWWKELERERQEIILGQPRMR